MGTVVERERKDGSPSFTAQIAIKKDGKAVHREAKTFDRRQAAFAWLEKREEELKAPGGLERRDDVPLHNVVDRYFDEFEGTMGRTKKSCLERIRDSYLGQIRCSEITSDKLVTFARCLKVLPQTRLNYFSHLSTVFEIALPTWRYPLSYVEFQNAMTSLKRLGLIGKSAQRERRPTLEELDKLMEHFGRKPANSCPMQKIIAFAIFSTRRQEEITLLPWADLDGDRILVRAMKDPRDKQANNIMCELTPEAIQIIDSMPRVGPRIFSYTTDAISAAFTDACKILGIEDLHFHDLRHEGISRLFEMGRTIPQVAVVSGHKSWSSLKRYTHIRATGDKYADWKWLPIVTSP